ncbi:hypothetical protein [Tardiphaga sp. 813_E8_N1_3]|uniref:hypothetical protein n=1 Tax=Tardiphaga sp. 813_E8_N1_3 TaxID=3240760 RepID=UPI003F292679
MRQMRYRPIPFAVAAAVVVVLFAVPVSAQYIGVPGNPALITPLPPAPPPPRIEVPVVPQLGDLPRQQNVPQARGSFSDRITNCLQDGAAAGLGPNDRATYSRACANR